MNKGRRYDTNGKLNKKKVAAVIIAFAVIIMFFVGISKLLSSTPKNDEKVISIDYYSVYTNGKWGVINSKGETVLEPNYDEMVLVPNKTKKVFICTYDVDYDANTYKTKAVNEKNEQLFSQYEKVETLQNSDENNNLIIEENILQVTQNGKYGIIDLDGKEILPCEYDDIYGLEGIKNSIVISRGNKKGLIDSKGNIIISTEYTDIKGLTSKYENGFIVQNDQNKFGVVSYNKKLALECKYEEIKNIYGNNTYAVKEEGTLKLVDSQGNSYLAGKYDEFLEINENNIIVKKDSKVGVVNKTGEQVLPLEFEDLKYLYSNNYIAKKEGKYGIVNFENKTILDFNYTNLFYRETADFLEGTKQDSVESDIITHDFEIKFAGIVSEVNIDKGYVKIRNNGEDKYYTFKFEEKKAQDIFKSNTLFLQKKDGKYGFVNKNGVVVVNYIYDDAKEQDEYGFASVKKDGKWGAIDQKGTVVVEPKYTLENSFIIKFIGKWHLAEDLNANYYTDVE